MAIESNQTISAKEMKTALNGKANLGEALTVDLLWTNTNPSSVFVAQDIIINTLPYKVVFIEVAEDTTSQDFNTVVTLPRKGVRFPSLVTSSSSMWRRRDFTDTGTKILVGIGYKCSINEGLIENNSASIPLNIWGVK